MVKGNIEGGLAWWDRVQWWKYINPDQASVDAVIEEQVPKMLEGCIKKHMAL